MSRKRRSYSAAGALLATLFVLLLLSGGVFAWLLSTPYGPETEVFVQISPGSSTVHIGRQLQAVGVVRSGLAFDLMRWFQGETLKAGEYRFDHPAPLSEVYDRIARGDVFTRTVTIPEGSTVFDIAVRLQEAGLVAGQDFIEAQARLTDLVSDLDPGARSLEGYLFPDTYQFSRRATPEQICSAMVRRFRAVAAQIGLKENVHQVVTLASLVERETAVDADRPLVASVFVNRLAHNMPLMSDPAVIYGLELQGLWRGAIYRSDLEHNTPYNTYLHTGLPPGPIANPGLRSLRAALHPAQTNYLYFVAAGANAQGHSLFSSTIEEHHRNVAEYRHALKKAGER